MKAGRDLDALYLMISDLLDKKNTLSAVNIPSKRGEEINQVKCDEEEGVLGSSSELMGSPCFLLSTLDRDGYS